MATLSLLTCQARNGIPAPRPATPAAARDHGPGGPAAQRLAWLAFAWVMLDSMINYFVKTFTGTLFPVTAVLPVILLLVVMAWGWRAILPPASVMVALGIAVVGFLLGLVLVPDIGNHRIAELVGAYSTFAIGYFALRWAKDTDAVVRTILIVCSLYVLVCIVALLKLAPGIFPIVNSPWANHGVVVMRPEVMTDQNFQVFYLYPAVLLLALPYRFSRFWIAIALMLGGLYVLAQLQTRSGTLVFAGTLLMCLFAPIWEPRLGRGKLLLVPLLLIATVAIALPRILDEGGLLITRLTDANYETGYSRLESFLYLFEHLFNPLWWIPQGYDEFQKLHRTIPHSNVTAMFLEGGIAGLYMWVAVFLLPIVYLMKSFFRRQLDPLAILILIGGVSMLVVQLTLNVPFFKQPWLWAGAVMGTLYRVRAMPATDATRSSSPPKKPLIYTGTQSSAVHK